MAELRTILEQAGLEHVQTYIQSGNVVFQSLRNPAQIESDIKGAIMDHFNFDVPVLVRTHQDLSDILKNCPFEKEKKEKSYLQGFTCGCRIIFNYTQHMDCSELF